MGSYSIYPIVYIYAVLFYVLIKGRVGFSLFLLTLFLFAALRGDEASAKIRQNSTKQNVNRSTAKYSFFFEDDQLVCINLSK